MRKAEALDLIQHVMEDLGIPVCHWAAHTEPARIIEELQAAVNKPLPEPIKREEPEILELTP